MGKSYQLAVLEALGFKAVAILLATPTPVDTLTGVGRTHNAALRGECRTNQLSADHFHHQTHRKPKNATRHESLFNALLCNNFTHVCRHGLRTNDHQFHKLEALSYRAQNPLL